MKKLLLIDGNAIFHRAFHGLPLFKTSKGEYTNAIYGFLRMFIEIVKREKPEYVAVAFDRAAPTFRHEEYKEYKANRSAPPEELYPQLPGLKEALAVFNVPIFELDGYEADDIIGTIATKAEADPEIHTLILTGDRDALQLVTGKTHVVAPVKGVSEVLEYTPAMVKEKTGLTPDQIIDYKSLKGDTSDNIKGVDGIGEKGAVELLQKYGNLENIYKHLDELSPGIRKKLAEGEKDAEFSKRLATIVKDVPIRVELEECRFTKAPFPKAKALFEKMEFRTLLKQIDTLKELIEPETKAQQSMF
jgi:DNA polymerase-1